MCAAEIFADRQRSTAIKKIARDMSEFMMMSLNLGDRRDNLYEFVKTECILNHRRIISRILRDFINSLEPGCNYGICDIKSDNPYQQAGVCPVISENPNLWTQICEIYNDYLGEEYMDRKTGVMCGFTKEHDGSTTLTWVYRDGAAHSSPSASSPSALREFELLESIVVIDGLDRWLTGKYSENITVNGIDA